MARKLRTSTIGARLSDSDYQIIAEYTEKHEINIADLIRVAVSEYMAKYPTTKEQ